MVPELWDKTFVRKVWSYLDPWDSVRLRTASTHWKIEGKYGPLSRLFFLIMKEQAVASNEGCEVLLSPRGTLKACPLCWWQTTKWDQVVCNLLI